MTTHDYKTKATIFIYFWINKKIILERKEEDIRKDNQQVHQMESTVRTSLFLDCWKVYSIAA